MRVIDVIVSYKGKMVHRQRSRFHLKAQLKIRNLSWLCFHTNYTKFFTIPAHQFELIAQQTDRQTDRNKLSSSVNNKTGNSCFCLFQMHGEGDGTGLMLMQNFRQFRNRSWPIRMMDTSVYVGMTISQYHIEPETLWI